MHIALIVWLAVISCVTIMGAANAKTPGLRFTVFMIAGVHMFFMTALLLGAI